MKKNYIFIFVAVLGLVPGALLAQDLHYARVQDLSLWYNPALKGDKKSDIRLNYRDVRYQSMLSYRSSAVLGNISLNGKGSDNTDNSAYWNLSVGGAVDQSNQNILKNTQGILGLSYAVPLTGNNQYLAVSIQGSFINSRLDLTNAMFPDQFDRNGPISNAVTLDPLGIGTPRNWLSAHIGAALFQQGEDESWSLGVSVRDATRPLIQRGQGLNYRLQPTLGLQGSYEVQRGDTRYSVYGVANFKAEAYEQLLSASISHRSVGSSVSAVGGGLAYRLRDAFIPYVELGIGSSTIGLYYELNISGIKAAGYNRNAFEIGFKQQLSNKKRTTEK